jgi:type II secretory pathway pseudopilin PulG
MIMFAIPSSQRLLRKAAMPYSLHRQAGATLIEQVLVAIVIAGLLVAVFIGWNMVQTASNDNDNLRDIALLMSKVRSVFDGQSSYGTAALNSTLLTYRAVPASMINGSTITNPWGGAVVVTGTGATYSISSAAIPQESCATMVKNFAGNTGGGSGITAISVNGTAITLPVTPVSAATACNGATNTVLLTAS